MEINESLNKMLTLATLYQNYYIGEGNGCNYTFLMLLTQFFGLHQRWH